MKRAHLVASQIVLFNNTFVTNKLAAGEPESSLYDNRFPPTMIHTLYGSDLSGR